MVGEGEEKTGPLERLAIEALGACVTVDTDLPALAGRLRAELGPFVKPRGGGDPDVSVIAPDGAGLLAGHPLDPAHAVDQAYGLIFRILLDRIDQFIVLHGAVLAKQGRALLISGPSGAGKTTLTLALLQAGFQLLSDDFAPISRGSGRVTPFAKALGVRPGAAAGLAESAVGLAPQKHRVALPAAAWATEAETTLVAVLLMNGAEHPPEPLDTFPFFISHLPEADRLADAILRLAGVELLCRSAGRLEITIDPRTVSLESIEQIFTTHSEQVLEYGTFVATAGRRLAPTISPLSSSVALLLLLREIQNRRRDGALLRSVAGDPLQIAVELSRALHGVRCGWLAAGEPLATARLVEQFFAQVT